jgi:hypothetical protein
MSALRAHFSRAVSNVGQGRRLSCPDLQVKGCWLLDVAGGIHTFGRAPFLGNGGAHPSQAINIITVPSGRFPTKGYAYICDELNAVLRFLLTEKNRLL